ncbi:MAG: hypothetical protein H0W72_01705 [Planctomycetes bacterium]|nr:hypothetical protein [Planctomycetota bacterium]
MLRTIALLSIVALASLSAPPALCAEDAAEPVLGEAIATLRINDLRWLDREAASFANTSGTSSDQLRGLLAQIFFHARSYDGVDLSRPAVIAWRSGPAPLVAIIPLEDRRRFIADFGAITAYGSPLIRIGERDGTTVYTQNTVAGLREYRLLVQDDVAYIARTVAECRAMAARPLRQAAGREAPVTFTAQPAFFTVPASLAEWAKPAVMGLDAATALALFVRSPTNWDDLGSQVAMVHAELAPAADGVVRLSARLSAKADTVLAQWLALQKNVASRLLPAVRNGADVVAYGQVEWQGQLDRLGQRMVPAMRALAGERWTPQVEDAWRRYWEMADREGPFAFAMQLPRGGKAGFQRFVIERQRAAELLILGRLIEQVLSPLQSGIDDQAFSDANILGLTGFQVATTPRAHVDGRAVEAVPMEALVLADDRREYHACAAPGASQVDMEAILTAIAKPGAPEGSPALFGMLIDLTGLVASGRLGTVAADRVADRPLPQVSADMVVRATTQGDLTFEANLPAQRAAILLREANIHSLPLPDGPVRPATAR